MVEAAPAFEISEREDAGIQERNVAEKRELIIDAGREQHGRHEAADQAEHGDGVSVITRGEQHGGCRYADHQDERGQHSDQIVEDARGVDGEIEDENAAAGKNISVTFITACAQALREEENADARRAAEQHATARRDPFVLESDFEKEADADGGRDDAEPVEETPADELFQIAARGQDACRLRLSRAGGVARARRLFRMARRGGCRRAGVVRFAVALC
jgi:hypothetical protein